MAEPRLLPTIDPPAQGESLQAYGCRVLRFVVAENCTATLTDRDLELADHFYPIAIAPAELSPCVRERLANAQDLIRSALRGRAKTQPMSVPAAKHDDRPNIGPMATLLDVPIVRPPEGGRAIAPADVRF